MLPGKQLSVLPIGLAIFAGISVIALIVVGLVTYERTKYRRVGQYSRLLAHARAETISQAFRQRKLAESGAAMGYGGMAYVPLARNLRRCAHDVLQTGCLISFLRVIYSALFDRVDSADSCYGQHHGYRPPVHSVLVVMHIAHQVQTSTIPSVCCVVSHSEFPCARCPTAVARLRRASRRLARCRICI